jgi:hypothetical protein
LHVIQSWKNWAAGDGVVDKAEDTGLHRFVALRFQPQDFAKTPQAMGDAIGDGEAYQDFLALWKKGDANIPVLKQAQSEYAKLR